MTDRKILVSEYQPISTGLAVEYQENKNWIIFAIENKSEKMEAPEDVADEFLKLP